MYIKILLRLLFGYVRIEIEGYYVERFINICTSKKILIWNLKRKSGIKIYLNIGISDFKNIIKIAKKTKCKVKIVKKKGLPFLINRYRKRKIFIVFLIIVSIVIYISSKYVWNIEININDNEVIENIDEDLKNAGISQGRLKSNINTDEIVNNIRMKRQDIAWIGIDIKGTNVIVNIVKAKESPEIVSNTDYCDIVASKDGVIEKIVAQNGTALVKEGDSVKKGDVLIAGYMEGKYTDIRYVHALGEVTAIVEYSKSKEENFIDQDYQKTGKKENKYEILFNDKEIKLYKNESKYQYFDSKENEIKIKIWENFYLPISLKKITNEELEENTKQYTLEEAIKIAENELSSQIESKIEDDENIVNKDVEYVEGNNSVTVTVTYELSENIGEYRKIDK